MILITGGLGFIGAHTARALLDLGESCILTQRPPIKSPEFLAANLGTTVFVEPLDVADREAFLELGSRYQVTGIVHLAPGGGDEPDTFDAVRIHPTSPVNALHAARAWSVAGIGIASSLAVYQGVPGSVYRDDVLLPVTPAEPVPVLRKTAELAGALAAAAEDLDVVNLRLSTIWGPLRRHDESPFSAIPNLVHPGREPDRASAADPFVGYRDDGRDLCYVSRTAPAASRCSSSRTPCGNRTWESPESVATPGTSRRTASGPALPTTSAGSARDTSTS